MRLKNLLLVFVVAATANNSYSQCSTGGNGIASSGAITIDGAMTDWSSILSDPDNNTYDATPDTDAPISDVGRDFNRFAFTENSTHLFLYFSRVGSSTNSVDLLFYLDVNNNGLMETNEPVVTISWSGSNGNAVGEIYNYVQANSGGDAVSGDGSDMPGSLQTRLHLGNIGKGSASGTTLEVSVPFTQLYKQGSIVPLDMLTATEQFKFHVASINGSPSSVPGANSINDNFGGCYSGLMLLPVKLVDFKADRLKDNVNLSWQIADNENAGEFEIEESKDGITYKTIGKIDASSNSGKANYSFSTIITNQKSYYRLKMFDKDRAAQYSKVILIEQNDATAGNVLKLNNPVYSDLTIRYESKSQGSSILKLYHSSGALVFSRNIRLSEGQNVLTIPDNYLAIKGTYIVEVVNQYKERISKKIVKL